MKLLNKLVLKVMSILAKVDSFQFFKGKQYYILRSVCCRTDV